MMLRTRVPMLALASALAACDTTPVPTAPARPALSTALNAVRFPQGYVATRIPILPNAINDSGVIAGSVDYRQAALYHNGTKIVLSRPAGTVASYVATAINRRAVTVGSLSSGPGLYWFTPTAAPIVITAPNGGRVRPLAINGSNFVVGSFDVPGGTRAFRWTAYGGLQDITPPGYQWVEATDINDDGYIVGQGVPAIGEPRALRWAPGAGPAAVALAGRHGGAAAVRYNGDAIGSANEWPSVRLWTLAGQVHPLLGPAGSRPSDISGAGRVVGTTEPWPVQPWTTFQGTLTWLPVLSLANTGRAWALGLNACGSIVGQQEYNGGSDVAGVLWTKATCDVAGTHQ